MDLGVAPRYEDPGGYVDLGVAPRTKGVAPRYVGHHQEYIHLLRVIQSANY